VVEAQTSGRAVPANVFVVTFDDGYESNYLNALPILRELNVPATIFLATKYLDTDRPFPFDDWAAAGSSNVPRSAWRPLSTSQCHEMLATGLVELGAHTHSHERFDGRTEDFRNDLARCIEHLHDRFGIERPTFAFPFGIAEAPLAEAARQIGTYCGLTSRQQRVKPVQDSFSWGRFVVESSDTAPILAAKLSGWYSAIVGPGKAIKRSLELLTPSSRRPARQRGEQGIPGDVVTSKVASPL
jgi:peptidoglycan/xylan/chitin deacetylase (PgdA/CDA1 family)